MVTNIEQQNIEKGAAWWAENKINKYENLLKWKEIGKVETEEERNQANELLTQIQGIEKTDSEEKTIKKYPSILSPEIQTAIEQLNRQGVAAEIAESYVHTEETIKESPHDKNLFARWIWKVLNRIINGKNKQKQSTW